MNMPEIALNTPVDQNTFNHWFDQRLEEKLAEREAAHTPSLAIIATKGTLDMAYPPFILASTASALGWDVSIFFTHTGNFTVGQPGHAHENAGWPRILPRD